MGIIASYRIKNDKGEETETCRCHVCQMTFENLASIRQHFISSQKHYAIKERMLRDPTLDSFFHEEEIITHEH